ncbi:MAG: DUF1735 domain-containing protein [Ginsengibacter sp.]
MKKINNKYLGMFLVATLVLSLQSCLKNGKYYQDFSKGSPAVELPFAAKYTNRPYGIPWSPDTTTSFKVYVNVASVNVPSTPTTATLAIDKAWVDQYNNDQTAAASQAQQDYLNADPSHTVNDPAYPYSWIPMEVMPDSLFTVSSYDLTIPAGQREVYADVLVHSDKFAPGHNYVLPFTISNASVNISNWNHLPLWFISSPFAGTFTHYHSNSIKSGLPFYDFDDVVTLNTVDQHTVSQDGIADLFGGYTEYHFNGDGSVSVKAGSSSSNPNSYGASVVSSSSDATTGDFTVKFTILSGKYVFTETFKR